MRFIRLLLISFIFLFLLVTGISLFIPSHVRISKAINLKADKDTVMSHIGDPVKWAGWYPGLDSARLFYENGIMKGYILDRQSTAYIVLTGKTENEVTAEFVGPQLNPVINGWKLVNSRDSLTLQWYMDFHLRWYPWEKFASLLLEKSYGTKMEQGLAGLKKQVEK